MFGSLKVRLLGDAVLREKSNPVRNVGPVERMLIAAMKETMRAHQGVGLAAPQVGISEQIFIVDSGKEAMSVINPKILEAFGKEENEEGCLSIPGVRVKVVRAKTIHVEFFDENNQKVQTQLSGLTAKIFQHEFDHLQGRLIIDYLSAAEQKKVLKAVAPMAF